MSLFNRTSPNRQQNQSALSPAEAFTAITLIAIAIDGYAADAEIGAINAALSRMQLFRSYPNDVMRKMIDRLLNLLQRQGADMLLNAAVTTLPHDLQETAFAMAADIVLADGDVTEEEEALLNKLYRNLGISEENALKIIDVMIIKNRG